MGMSAALNVKLLSFFLNSLIIKINMHIVQIFLLKQTNGILSHIARTGDKHQIITYV